MSEVVVPLEIQERLLSQDSDLIYLEEIGLLIKDAEGYKMHGLVGEAILMQWELNSDYCKSIIDMVSSTTNGDSEISLYSTDFQKIFCVKYLNYVMREFEKLIKNECISTIEIHKFRYFDCVSIYWLIVILADSVFSAHDYNQSAEIYAQLTKKFEMLCQHITNEEIFKSERSSIIDIDSLNILISYAKERSVNLANIKQPNMLNKVIMHTSALLRVFAAIIISNITRSQKPLELNRKWIENNQLSLGDMADEFLEVIADCSVQILLMKKRKKEEDYKSIGDQLEGSKDADDIILRYHFRCEEIKNIIATGGNFIVTELLKVAHEYLDYISNSYQLYESQNKTPATNLRQDREELDLYLIEKYNSKMLYCYDVCALFYYIIGDLDVALNFRNKALSLVTADRDDYINNLIYVAWIPFAAHDYYAYSKEHQDIIENSLNCLLKIISLNESSKSKLARAYYGLAWLSALTGKQAEKKIYYNLFETYIKEDKKSLNNEDKKSLNNEFYALEYEIIGNYDQSINLLMEELPKSIKKNGMYSFDTSVFLKDIGRLYAKAGDNQNAIRYYNDALNILTNHCGFTENIV